jgi:tRNA pseudouridine55 synthase
MDVPELSGILNLYKPVGKSSAFYVYLLRGILGVRKVGHAGSLDPFADGVLLACIGKGTKLVERLMSLPKRYRTTLRLGVTNATFDTERPFEPVPDAKPVDRSAIEAVLAKMVGEVEQVPPSFSAMRIGGVSAYKLAKHGKPTPLEPRTVRIDEIKVLNYAWPLLTLEIACGRGTDIREIARDFGAAFGYGACCETLTRLAVGPFRIEDAVRMEGLSQTELRARVHTITDVTSGLGNVSGIKSASISD